YVPARPHTGQHGRPPVAAPTGTGEADRHHPLHRVYRKRIRGIRMRWFGSGMGLGVLVGILLTLIASALVVTQIPSAVQNLTGEPDVAVAIDEGFLNRQAAQRLEQPYNLGVPNLTLRALNIDLKPDNRMDMQ